MESSKEKIEAQLCAYIEGELDDAERAEIEQHLAANPQHQALIAELRAASGLLRDLPRIPAPMDLNESLCGTIERGALLDPSDDHGTPGLRVNRWPQFTAVAAVLILAVGLGLVIYYVLPPSGGHARPQLAIDDRSRQPEPSVTGLSKDRDADAPSGNTRSGEKGDGADLGDDRGREKALAESEMKSRGANPAAGGKDDRLFGVRNAAPANPAPANPDLDVARRNLHDRGMVTPSDVESVRKWMNESLGADSNFFNSASNTSLYLVVSTPNTAAANGQLAAYFKGNGILYMADESRPAAGRGANGRAAGGETGVDDYALSAPSPQAGKTFNYGGAGFGGGGGDSGSGLAAGGGAGPAVAVAATPQLQPKDNPAPAAVAAPAPKPDLTSVAGGRAMQRAPESTKFDASKKETSLDADKLDVARADGTLKHLSQAVTKQSEVTQDAIAADKADATASAPGGLEGAAGEAEVRARRGLSAKESLVKDNRPTAEKIELRDGDRPTSRAKRLEEESIGRNNVIIARMNRRQLNELSAELSREQGQRAELLAPSQADGLADASAKAKAAISSLGAPLTTELQSRVVDPKALTLNNVVPATLTPAKPVPPATPAAPAGGDALSLGTNQSASAAAVGRVEERFYDRSELGKNRLAATAATQLTMGRGAIDSQTTWAAKVPAQAPADAPAPAAGAGDQLHLKIDPMEEPVDVVIVVKAAPAFTGAAALEATSPATDTAAKPAPAAPTDLKK